LAIRLRPQRALRTRFPGSKLRRAGPPIESQGQPLAKGANRSSNRRKLEPNTAISRKQFYLKAHTLYLSAQDRCELIRSRAVMARFASSITTNPDLLPVGFVWLRHSGRWLWATGLLLARLWTLAGL
jgi:hypothetical protein